MLSSTHFQRALGARGALIFPTLAYSFIFVAWLLLLLVMLSVPIAKSIYFVKISAQASSSFLDSEAGATVVFGVSGYCTYIAPVEVVGIQASGAKYDCPANGLGYSFIPIKGLSGLSQDATNMLVMHLVDLVLLTVAVISTVILRNRSPASLKGTRRKWAGIHLLVVLTAFLTFVTFCLDCGFSGFVLDHLNGVPDVTATRGSVTWLTMASWLLQMGAIVAFAYHDRRRMPGAMSSDAQGYGYKPEMTHTHGQFPSVPL